MFARLAPYPRVTLVLLALTLTCCLSHAADIGKINATYRVTDFRHDAGFRITSFNPNIGESAIRDGVLTCDFTRSPGYIGVGLDTEPLRGIPSAVTLTYQSNTSGHPIVLRFQDSDGQFFQKQIAVLDSDGVKAVTVPLSDMSTWTHFHGRDDGTVRPPLKVVEIIVDHNGNDTSLKLMELTATSEISLDQAVSLRVAGRKRVGTWESLSLTCTSLLSKPVSGRLSWTVTDLFGKRIDAGVRSETMTSGRDLVIPVRVRVGDVRLCDVKLDVDVMMSELGGSSPKPLKDRGRDTSTARDTVRVTKTASTSVVGPPSPEGRTNDLLTDSPFGMGIYLGQRYPLDKMDMVATMGHDIGVKWMRDEFNWGRLEPERGKWNWEPYDKAVDASTRNGISIFGLLCYWSPWTKPYTEEGVRDYCDYVKAVVGRYKDRIKYWEIWNEPNIFFWQGTVEQYATLLKAAYIAVKETDPQAKVIGCCTAGTDLGFVEKVLQFGGYDSIDILSIHPYRYPGTPEQTDFIGELRKADELLTKYGGPKQIWLTEIGWPTNVGSNGSSEAKQAAMIVRTYIQAIVSGVVQKTFWYNYRNDGTDVNYNEHNFGIIRQDYSTKPAYSAFGAMTRALEGKRFSRTLDTPQGVCAYLFEDKNDQTLAAWCVSGTSTMTVISQSPLSVMDLVGRTTSIEPTNGKVDIALTQLPVFVSGMTDDVKVTTSTHAAESALSDPVSVTVLPKGPMSFAVELRRQPAKWNPVRVQVRLPGHADAFDLPTGKASHIETYDLPHGMSIGDGSLVPVTVTIQCGDRQTTRTSNVSYTLCRKLHDPSVAVAQWDSASIKLGREGDFQLADGGAGQWSGQNDLSAEVATAWSKDALLISARVTDDIFSNEFDGDSVWKGDSIQFAIDPDHTEDVALGRVYEIGLARTPKGPQVYCWSAPAGEKTGLIQAEITVRTDSPYTYYTASVPLSELPSLKPAVGKVIGFSILINDNDGQGREGWIEWTPGVGRGKSPALYGDLVFTN